MAKRHNRNYFPELNQEAMDDLEIILKAVADMCENESISGAFSNRMSRTLSSRRIRTLLRLLKGEAYTPTEG